MSWQPDSDRAMSRCDRLPCLLGTRSYRHWAKGNDCDAAYRIACFVRITVKGWRGSKKRRTFYRQKTVNEEEMMGAIRTNCLLAVWLRAEKDKKQRDTVWSLCLDVYKHTHTRARGPHIDTPTRRERERVGAIRVPILMETQKSVFFEVRGKREV